MATILFNWELGAGLGHIMELAPLVSGLAAQGHRVYAAMRELPGAHEAFGPAATLLAAPFYVPPRGTPSATRNFADLLADLTFGSDRVLAPYVAAWRGLYDLVRPDVIVFDHSPTALLAARGMPVRRVVVGNGFLIPPDVCPMPYLRPWAPLTPEAADAMRANEQAVLERANRLLESTGQPALDRLGRLYSDVDLTLLMTFRELDPYAAARPEGTRYLGAVNATGGAAPPWPDGNGKRVYAYLWPFPAMTEVLKYLGERALPTVVYMRGLTDGLRKRFNYPTLRLTAERLDLAQAGRECDVAVLNGNLGTSSAMLLAGRPALHLPEHLEHMLNARAVARLHAGLVAPMKEPGIAIGRLDALLGSSDIPAAVRAKAGATAFAERYAGFDPRRQAAAMMDALAGVLGAEV